MKTPWGWLGLNIAIFTLLFLGLRVLSEGPTPPVSDFDHVRAYETLRSLNPDDSFHPAGTEENNRVRDRIETALTDIGLSVERQSTVYCDDGWPGCTAVDNIIAVKSGKNAGGDAIMLTSHFDSVPASPGASDDLAGAAAMLEIARITSSEIFENDVVYLFTDGEETGLRGAMAFANEHPLMDRIKLVLNVEARGVAGPSTMFETSNGNIELLELYASSGRRPVANSLMFEIYRKMPNDTDMTVYKEAGAEGLNFAYSRGVSLYHSSRDNTDNTNIRSLAHHGDNMLTTLRSAGNMSLPELASEQDATYFDLFGASLFYWPSSYNLPAAIVIILTLLVVGVRTGAIGFGKIAWSLLGVLSAIILLGASGWLLSFPLGIWPGIHPLDHPYPLAGRLSLVGASILTAFMTGGIIAKRAGMAGSLFIGWLVIAIGGAAIAVLLPGGAYVMLAPAAIFAAIALPESFVRAGKAPVIAAHVGLIAAAYMALYHFLFFDVVLNFQVSHFKTPIFLLSVLAAAPLVVWYTESKKSLLPPLGATVTVVLIAAIVGAVVPAYTETRPRSVNIAYHQTETAEGDRVSQWRLFTFGPADKEYVQSAGFPEQTEPFSRYTIRPSKAYFQPAEDHNLPAPVLEIISDEKTDDGGRILRGTLRSGRSGPYFGAAFPPEAPIDYFSINGIQLLDQEDFSKKRGRAAIFNGLGDQQLQFEIRTTTEEEIEIRLFEISPLPNDPVGEDIISKRPTNAAPLQFGDHADVQKTYRI